MLAQSSFRHVDTNTLIIMRNKLFYGLLFVFGLSYGQFADEYKGGMNIKFNDDGSKYLRFITWGQFWFQENEGNHPNDGISVRRARVLMYSQINKRFLIVTHFGLNSLNDNNLSPTGKNGDTQLFLHDAWGEFNVIPELQIGAGLHYWNGISRYNSASTLNFLTLDNNRSSWSTLGLTDQFARHLGIYAKGKIGKFEYRASINDVLTNSLDGNAGTVLQDGQELYLGKALLNEGKYAYAGYFEYQFLDSEANLLPFKVGTYMGTKKVFNVGAGFFYHPEGIAKNNGGILESGDVSHVSADVFYDSPVGASGGSITAYAMFQNSKMGDDYLNGRIYGNGSQVYAQAGYLIPKGGEEENKFKNRFQPYAAYSHRDFKGLIEPAKELRLGTNWYIDGQNAKLTIEYQKAFDLPKGQDDQLTIQAMIYL